MHSLANLKEDEYNLPSKEKNHKGLNWNSTYKVRTHRKSFSSTQNSRFWSHWIWNEMQIYSIGRSIVVNTREVQERAKNELRESFKLLEGELGEKTYFGGEEFGLVDVALIPFYSRFYAFETFGKLSISEEFPKLVGWAQRCMQRDSVSKSLPDPYKVYDFLCEIRPMLAPIPHNWFIEQI